ncbi:MAG: hypothetical protein R3F07_16530 [Opitutaceae bacterium]
MTKRLFILPLFAVLLSASSFGHTAAYPHGHPHGAATSWMDVLIMGGIVAVIAFGTSAILRWRNESRPTRQRIRQD